MPRSSARTRPPIANRWPPGSSSTRDGSSRRAGSQAVNIVEVEIGNPVITFESALSNGRVAGLERTSSQAQNHSVDGHRVVAAINGDVWAGFSNDMEHAPNGLHVEAGELITAGPAGRPTFGVGADGRPVIGSPLVAVTLTTSLGIQHVINRVNQLRRPGEAVLYTPQFGSRTSTAASGVDILIGGLALPLRTSGGWTGIVSQTRPAEGGGPIDPGTVVLTVPATSPLVGLIPGETVSFASTVTAGWESIQHAVGGREWIVRDGVTSISPRPASADEIHPRSAIGITADNRLILATVDGRQPGWSAGIRLPELAELMLSRGAVVALNLDGGGSTSLAIRRAGTNGAVLVNRPSDGSERAVTNSIQVISNAPTGPLATLNVQPGTRTVYRNAALDFTASGMDSAYNPVPLGGGQLAWSVSPALGTIDAAGHFVATTPGTGQVIASANGVSGAANITVLVDETAPVAQPPRVTLPVGRALASTVPVLVAWNAASDSGSGVASYELQRSVDGKAWATMPKSSPASRSTTLSLPRNHTYQFQVRAVDMAGNVGAWRQAGSFKLAVTQESTRALTFVKGTWSRTTSPSYDGGAARSTRTTGGIARFTFTGNGVRLDQRAKPGPGRGPGLRQRGVRRQRRHLQLEHRRPGDGLQQDLDELGAPDRRDPRGGLRRSSTDRPRRLRRPDAGARASRHRPPTRRRHLPRRPRQSQHQRRRRHPRPGRPENRRSWSEPVTSRHAARPATRRRPTSSTA